MVDLVVVRLGVFHLQRLIHESFLLLLFLLWWSSSRHAAHNFVVNSFCYLTCFLFLMNVPFRPDCTFLLHCRVISVDVVVVLSVVFHLKCVVRETFFWCCFVVVVILASNSYFQNTNVLSFSTSLVHSLFPVGRFFFFCSCLLIEVFYALLIIGIVAPFFILF